MLHHLISATIQVANLVNYNCHPHEEGNERFKSRIPTWRSMTMKGSNPEFPLEDDNERFKSRIPTWRWQWKVQIQNSHLKMTMKGSSPEFPLEDDNERFKSRIPTWRGLVGWFCCFTSQVNSYGHCGTVSSPNHTFSWAGLNKPITSNSCSYFRL